MTETTTPRIRRNGDVTIDGRTVGHVTRTLERGHGRNGTGWVALWVAADANGTPLGRHHSRALAVRSVALFAAVR